MTYRLYLTQYWAVQANSGMIHFGSWTINRLEDVNDRLTKLVHHPVSLQAEWLRREFEFSRNKLTDLLEIRKGIRKGATAERIFRFSRIGKNNDKNRDHHLKDFAEACRCSLTCVILNGTKRLVISDFKPMLVPNYLKKRFLRPCHVRKTVLFMQEHTQVTVYLVVLPNWISAKKNISHLKAEQTDEKHNGATGTGKYSIHVTSFHMKGLTSVHFNDLYGGARNLRCIRVVAELCFMAFWLSIQLRPDLNRKIAAECCVINHKRVDWFFNFGEFSLQIVRKSLDDHRMIKNGNFEWLDSLFNRYTPLIYMTRIVHMDFYPHKLLLSAIRITGQYVQVCAHGSMRKNPSAPMRNSEHQPTEQSPIRDDRKHISGIEHQNVEVHITTTEGKNRELDTLIVWIKSEKKRLELTLWTGGWSPHVILFHQVLLPWLNRYNVRNGFLLHDAEDFLHCY
ncbi:hypothetical protein CLF_103148, partial [Clonorchis sinensis]